MYTLEDMRRFPLWDKNTFIINYEVDLDGDNNEWRECISHILKILENYYHIEIISEPTFEPHEDFVELTYNLNGDKIIIGNDFLFHTIWIEAKTVERALEIQKILADVKNLPTKRITGQISRNSDYSQYNIQTEIPNNISTIQTNNQLKKNMMLNNQTKENGTWKWGILCLIFLAPFFFWSYGLTNHYASGLINVPSIVFDWEKHIPLWGWTIVPYWSIDLFYGLSLLICWNKFELRQQVSRLLLAQIIAIACFFLFPLKFSFERPPLDGFFGLWFDALMGFDKPFNQLPSLHIVLLVILWDFYHRHVNGTWKFIVDFWCLLIGISVLTTWQHHFIDVPTGLLVGAICLWLFPISTKSPFRKDPLQRLTPKHLKLGSYYLCGSVICFILAYELNPWGLWFIYPAISLFIVAHSYSLVRPHFFQKDLNGQMSMASKMLLAPYLIFAWLNSRIWTRKHPEDSFVIEIENKKIYLGRIPSVKNAQQYQGIFDCIAELPLCQNIQYQQYLSLDLIPLQANQLTQAVENFNQLFNDINNINESKVLICCALGYSRSSSVLAAWLIQQNYVLNINDALELIRKARPWVVLKEPQIQELNVFHLKLKGLAP